MTRHRTAYWLADDKGPRAAWGFYSGPGAKGAAIWAAREKAKTVHEVGDTVVRVVKVVTITYDEDVASFPSPLL